MIVTGVFYLYLFSRWEWCGVVVVCWCGGRFSAGGDGWFYPNRFYRLGCRFGVQIVRAIEVLRVLYMSHCVGFQVIVNYYILYYYFLRCALYFLVAICVFSMVVINVGDCLYL